ncbi:hypothetical protein Pla110_40670 [Polystyrenella longa]|uniref:Mu-protocadherin-putative cell-suface protein n=1 Tax=Polystyrenella longa TaxID=2528007 RepID=A0A518CSV4_9PLAN|nr:hypothetical protein [Polystyrenella longa]QDU82312.1 hypothetical protein Pla110_40670 [Polystyrenella longa]
MKRIIFLLAIVIFAMQVSDAFARGGRGGGGGHRGGGGHIGGGGGRPNISRPSPSMSRPNVSRPSVNRPSTRPSVNQPSANRPSANRPSTLPSTNRPNVSRPNTNRPAGNNRPDISRPDNNRPNVNRPGGNGSIANRPAGNRPQTLPGNRPSSGDLKNFLDLPGDKLPSNRPDISNKLPGDRNPGDRLPGNNNPGDRLPGDRNPGDRLPGDGGKPGDRFPNADRPGKDRPGDGIADRFPNRDHGHDKWADRKDNIGNDMRHRYDHWADNVHDHHHWDDHYNHWHDHYDHWHFHWNNYPRNYWWRAATWTAMGTWFLNPWNQPYQYDYGNTVYYQNDTVYYQDKPVASAEEYAGQAESIAADVPEEIPEKIEWMPLGVYAISKDDSGESNMALQLAVSKEGYIVGSYYNTTTNNSVPVEGTVDRNSQRAAWKLSEGDSDTVMETGIYNLTQDQTVALVHFGKDRTEEWLMVRLDEPKDDGEAGATSDPATPQTAPDASSGN